MSASERDNNLFFRLIKNQRSTSSQFTQVLQANDKEACTPEDINLVFKDHFAKLAKQSNHPTFNEDHDKLVNLDAETIVNICENDEVTIQPVTSVEIAKIISSLKRRKSVDVDQLTTEHLLYGGDATVDYLTTLINNIFYIKHVSDMIKKGLLTPVHKKDKDPAIPSNYRGITVISITCKVLELCIRSRIEDTLNKHQNKLQKVFTMGVSSINIALLITEAINEAKDNNENNILITLDAEKAFDVVDHIHLFWKLYHQGITGSTWLLIKELYNKPTTQVKCQGQISEPFVNHQGIKQGGILSANFYKAYNKGILDTLENTNIRYKIGTNYIGCPTCADDIMLCGGSEHDAFTQLRIIEHCTSNDRVKINSKKTEILQVNKKNKELNLKLFDENITEKAEYKTSWPGTSKTQ